MKELPAERPAVARLTTGALLLLGGAVACAWVISAIQTAKLKDREAEWNLLQAEYERLSNAEHRLARLEAAEAELRGSWQRRVPIGALFQDCARQFPPSIPVGKINLETAYQFDGTDAGGLHAFTLRHSMQAVIAARCFADPAESEILSLISALQDAPEIEAFVRSVSLEGIQKNEARENGNPANTVFALRLSIPDRRLHREAL